MEADRTAALLLIQREMSELTPGGRHIENAKSRERNLSPAKVRTKIEFLSNDISISGQTIEMVNSAHGNILTFQTPIRTYREHLGAK